MHSFLTHFPWKRQRKALHYQNLIPGTKEKTSALYVPKYPVKPGDLNLAMALQYGMARGIPQLQEVTRNSLARYTDQVTTIIRLWFVLGTRMGGSKPWWRFATQEKASWLLSGPTPQRCQWWYLLGSNLFQYIWTVKELEATSYVPYF